MYNASRKEGSGITKYKPNKMPPFEIIIKEDIVMFTVFKDVSSIFLLEEPYEFLFCKRVMLNIRKRKLILNYINIIVTKYNIHECSSR